MSALCDPETMDALYQTELGGVAGAGLGLDQQSRDAVIYVTVSSLID